MQPDADERVGQPDRSAADRATDRTPEYHPGHLTDDHQRQDEKQRGEELPARRVDVADDVWSEHDAGDRAEDHPDERHERTQCTRTPSGDRGNQSHADDGDVQPLRARHTGSSLSSRPFPTSAIASSNSRTSSVSHGCAHPATSSIAEITWPVNPHTNISLSRNAGPA